MKKVVELKIIRQLIADYMYSEGCSCCQDRDAHEINKMRLAAILDVPPYEDGSGYDFYQFRTKEEEK